MRSSQVGSMYHSMACECWYTCVAGLLFPGIAEPYTYRTHLNPLNRHKRHPPSFVGGSIGVICKAVVSRTEQIKCEMKILIELNGSPTILRKKTLG